MIEKISKFLSANLGPYRKLVKVIKDDNYKNWEQHFNSYNQGVAKKAIPQEMKTLGMEVYEHNLKECLSNLRLTGEKKALLSSIQNYFSLNVQDLSQLKRKIGLKAVDLLSQYRLRDNSLSDSEKYEIHLLASELNVSKEEADNINRRNATSIYQKAVESKISGGTITDSEQKEIEQLALSMGLSPANIQLDHKIKQRYDYLLMLNELEKGYLPTIHNAPIVMQKNEVAHWQTPATLLVSKTVTTGYVGGSSGISVRVMKGVRYRVGSSRSTPIKQEVTIRHAGSLVVTSKRVVFTGATKSFSIGYNQLLSFDPFNNGIGLQKTNGPGHLLELANFQSSEVTFKILENAINNFFV